MVIIPNRVGQLGNQLFHLAHFAASAIENDFKVVFASFEFPLDYFPKLNSNKQLKVLRAKAVKNKWQYRFARLLRLTISTSPWHECLVSLEPPHLDTGSVDFVRKAKKKILFCEGFAFRDPKNLAKHFEGVVDLLDYNAATKNEVSQFFLSKGIAEDDFVVGFHVRRADYREYEGGKYFIEDEQWISIIQLVREQVSASGNRFIGIIFSNENVGFLTKSRDDLILGLGGMLTDLAMMARCNLIIAPPSTYSGWASFSGRVPLLHIDKSTDSIDISVAKPLEW
jgi:hypothetical protein